ncbi:MAG: 30S ribosomal protein S6 [Anaerolineales bacterium]|nr:30S ribosomal protein S6 [Anaerolineales bacterium]
MRNYELAYVADPELDEQSLASLEEKIKGWIEAAGGNVTGIDRWGRRRLAYPIRKRSDGFYVFFQVELPTTAGEDVERDLRLNEQILRYMITSQEIV